MFAFIAIIFVAGQRAERLVQVTNTKSTQIAFQSYYLCQRKVEKSRRYAFSGGVSVTYNESWEKIK